MNTEAKSGERFAEETSVQQGRRLFQQSQRLARRHFRKSKIRQKARKAAHRRRRQTGRHRNLYLMLGSGVVVMMLLLVSLVGGVMSSALGIFFTPIEGEEEMLTITDAIRQLDAEFTHELDEIQKQYEYDQLSIEGHRTSWKEVLSAYAVTAINDSTTSGDLWMMNSENLQRLREVFWQMNEIEGEMQEESHTIIEETVDEEGNIEKNEVITITHRLILHIYPLTAEEYLKGYDMTEMQQQQLEALLSPDMAELWNRLLYGNVAGGDLLAVAQSQVGNVGGEIYWRWYGFSAHVEWCACFISWCAEQCGYLENGVIPRTAVCSSEWYAIRGRWRDRTYMPSPGDIIMFDWIIEGIQDGLEDHIGVVEYVEDGWIHTIEGNSGDAVKRQRYRMDSQEIYGYGIVQVE